MTLKFSHLAPVTQNRDSFVNWTNLFSKDYMTVLAAASLADVLRASSRVPAPQENARRTSSVKEAIFADTSRFILIDRLINRSID